MIGNDYDIPVMYKDLGTYSMNPFGSPYGGGMMMPGMMPGMMQGMMPGMMQGMMPGMYNGIGSMSYLGGVRLAPQLEHDKVQLINRKEREGNKTLKNVAKALGVLLLIGFIPHFGKHIKKAGGIGKYISKQCSSMFRGIKKWF